MNDSITSSIQNNIWVKIGIAVAISFLLMIPVAHIKDVIKERNQYGEVAKKEVAQKWSESQVAGAVVLSIPAVQKIKSKDEKGKTTVTDNFTTLHFLPKNLKISADTNSVIRYRGVYQVPLYETKLVMSGNFDDINLNSLDLKDTVINWKKAELTLGIKEVRGLKSVLMKWNDEKLKETVGQMPSEVMSSSINGKIIPDKELIKNGNGKFFIEVTLRGSEALEFYPFGEVTEVSMAANWGSPSFKGAFLPESHEIEDTKFQAQWKVLGLTRSLPKQWEGDNKLEDELADTKFGVDLHLQLQSYQLNTRSVKYSLLFILLTFVTMFFIEIIYKLKFHPMHYAMTGASLILFYLLLLSFSEHLGFAIAYLVAALTTLITISMYVLGVTKVKKGAAIVFTQLGVLYGFLFVLLQQEDFTLVIGALGLWLILAVLMYATRKIDWFNLGLTETSKEV